MISLLVEEAFDLDSAFIVSGNLAPKARFAV